MRYIYELEKLLKDWAPVDGARVKETDRWYTDRLREVAIGEDETEVVVQLNVDHWTGVLTFDVDQDLSLVQLDNLTKLLPHVKKLADKYEKVVADARAEEERKRAEQEAKWEAERQERIKAMQEEQERRRQERERRLAAMEDHKDTLMNELVGEEGRIRVKGLKRWRPVTVDVRENHDGTYEPYFKYRYTNKHGYEERVGLNVQAFHVKLGSKFYSVWDSGVEDLREYDRADVLKKKVAGEYTSGLTTDSLAEDVL